MYLGHGAKKEDEPWYAKKDDKAVKYKDTTTFKSKHKDKKKQVLHSRGYLHAN